MRPAGGHRFEGPRGGPTRGSPALRLLAVPSAASRHPTKSHKPGSACKAEASEFQYSLLYASMVPDMMPLIVKAQAVTPKQGVQRHRTA